MKCRVTLCSCPIYFHLYIPHCIPMLHRLIRLEDPNTYTYQDRHITIAQSKRRGQARFITKLGYLKKVFTNLLILNVTNFSIKCNFGSFNNISLPQLSVRFFCTEKINNNFPARQTPHNPLKILVLFICSLD